MHMDIVVSCLRSAIPAEGPASILMEQNFAGIASAVAESIDDDGVILTWARIAVDVELISLYALHPEMRWLVCDVYAAEEGIQRAMEVFYLALFRKLGYWQVETINPCEFFVLELCIRQFPFDPCSRLTRLCHEEPVPRHRTAFELSGALLHCTGSAFYVRQTTEHASSTWRCTNRACASRAYVLSIGERAFKIMPENKCIVRTALSKKQTPLPCSACKTGLVNVRSNSYTTYTYLLSFSGTYAYFTLNRKIANGVGTVVGHLRRNGRGQLHLKGLGYFSYAKRVPRLLHEPRAARISDYLSLLTKSYTCTETDTSVSDVVLFIILNIFNSGAGTDYLESPLSNTLEAAAGAMDHQPGRPMQSGPGDTGLPDESTEWPSPPSLSSIELKETERQLNNAIKEKALRPSTKMLIYTNDVAYVKAVAANVTDERIVYTLEGLRAEGSCLCIRHVADKDNAKLRKLADYAFVVSTEGLANYTYKPKTLYRPPRQTTQLEGAFVAELKGAYMHFRKICRGTIEPYRLIATIMAIMLSVGGITNGNFSAAAVAQAVKKLFSGATLAI
ncbi:hypothetical protein PAPHI01_0722 [Pancytospora philotis]|nr:hypothetical protein PAPHI01_0722 [Pancytospora philotis]